MTVMTENLTRAEAAYAHLASFQRGDRVTVTDRAFVIEGTVTEPQRDGATIRGAYLTVSGEMIVTVPGDRWPPRTVAQSVVTVDMLLYGRTIRKQG